MRPAGDSEQPFIPLCSVCKVHFVLLIWAWSQPLLNNFLWICESAWSYITNNYSICCICSLKWRFRRIYQHEKLMFIKNNLSKMGNFHISPWKKYIWCTSIFRHIYPWISKSGTFDGWKQFSLLRTLHTCSSRLNSDHQGQFQSFW